MVLVLVMAAPVDPCVRDVDRERPRFCFGEQTEHESSVQLTELFDGDRVAYKNHIKKTFSSHLHL